MGNPRSFSIEDNAQALPLVELNALCEEVLESGLTEAIYVLFGDRVTMEWRSGG